MFEKLKNFIYNLIYKNYIMKEDVEHIIDYYETEDSDERLFDALRDLLEVKN